MSQAVGTMGSRQGVRFDTMFVKQTSLRVLTRALGVGALCLFANATALAQGAAGARARDGCAALVWCGFVVLFVVAGTSGSRRGDANHAQRRARCERGGYAAGTLSYLLSDLQTTVN